MITSDLLVDGFGRVREAALAAVDGVDEDGLAHRLDGRANSMAWLVWHLTRVQDDHVAEVASRDQLWTADGWHDRFALPLDRHDTGYGHTSEQVDGVRASEELLAGYLTAVHEKTIDYLTALTGENLDRIVDGRYDPPVTLGVRLVSVIADGLQHAGQAAFVRGLLPH